MPESETRIKAGNPTTHVNMTLGLILRQHAVLMSNVLSCSFITADLQESIVCLCNSSKIQAMCWGGAATGGGVLIGVPQQTWLCCKCVQQKAWRGKEVLCTALQCLHLQQNAGLYNDLRTVLTVFLSCFRRQSSSTHANGAWALEQPKSHSTLGLQQCISLQKVALL